MCTYNILIALYFLIKSSFVSLLQSSSKLILCFCHWRLLLTSNLIKSLAKRQNISPISAVIFTGCVRNLELLAFLLVNILGLFFARFGFHKFFPPACNNATYKSNCWYWGNILTLVFGLTYTNPRPSQVKAFLFYETFH